MTATHASTSTSTASGPRTGPYRWAADSRQANSIETNQAPQASILLSSRGETRVTWYSPPHCLAIVQIIAINDQEESREPEDGAAAWRTGTAWLPIRYRYIRPSAADLEAALKVWLNDRIDEADEIAATDDDAPAVPDRIALYVRIPTAPEALPHHSGPFLWFGTYDSDGDIHEHGDELTVCDDCGETLWNDHAQTVDGGDTVGNDDACDCLSSYVWCSDCQTYYPNNDNGAIVEGDYVCSHCLDRGDYYYHECSGEWSTEPPEPDDDDDDEPQGPDGMCRYGYHTDANDRLGHTIPDTGHTYGAELEYKGSPDDWPAVAAACQGRAILTNDSTVTGELVSAALSAGQIRRWLSSTAAALAGTRNDSNTGMHIHADRRALTPWQWHTLSHYAAKHSATLEAIAGRGPNQWSDLQSLPAADWPAFARNWQHRSWPNRYAGINLSKGPTVEFRINRATKTPARALARFGMIQRLTALGRLAPSQRPQTAEELRGWLAKDRHIAAVTGWKRGSFNYRAALMQPKAQGDQEPTPPTAEEIAALRDRLRSLEADRRLTECLAGNALAKYRSSTEGPDSPYTRDSWAQYLHYQRWADTLEQQISQARRTLQGAEALQSLQSLNR